MIDRTLSGLNRVVAELRRDVDALEKRPLCRGKGGSGPDHETGSLGYGWAYLVHKQTGEVRRYVNGHVTDPIMTIPIASDFLVPGWTVKSVLVFNSPEGYRIADLKAGTISGLLRMPPKPDGSPGYGTWYSGAYWVYEDGGDKLCVLSQYRYGSEGWVTLCNVRTGNEYADMKGRSANGGYFDVTPHMNAPLVTRDTPGGNGLSFYMPEGRQFAHKFDTLLTSGTPSSSRSNGCYYSGAIRGGLGNSRTYYDIKTGAVVEPVPAFNQAGGVKTMAPNGLFIDGANVSTSVYGGSHGVTEVPEFLRVEYQHVPFHIYGRVPQSSTVGVWTATGKRVLTVAGVPGYDFSDWHVIIDSEFI